MEHVTVVRSKYAKKDYSSNFSIERLKAQQEKAHMCKSQEIPLRQFKDSSSRKPA